jgi:hypothetical protein
MIFSSLGEPCEVRSNIGILAEKYVITRENREK